MRGLPKLLTLWNRPKPVVGVTPHDVVFTENKWSLLHYRGQPKFKTPLLLVPSLINRHYVLDLMPGKSFAEWLVAQGHDVYCIDWGTPGPEDRFVSFDDIVDGAIGRALNQVSRRAGVTKSHVLGYCMGGTLAAAHATLHPERFQSFIALAAPVKFDDGGLLSQWTRSSAFNVDAMVDAFGTVPWQLMQSAFQMLRPTLGLSKAVMLLDRAWNDEFLDGFLALEAWGNDNVNLPGDFYRTYVKSLYRENAMVNGTLRVSGKAARLEAIDCPTLCVSFEQDNIVPREASAALVERISSRDKTELHLAGGHVGAVVSKHAAKTLWPQLSQWLAAREITSARKSARPTRVEPTSSETR